MPSATKRTFSLPDEQSEYIDKQVKTGTYGSASEVVRAGLRALQERDAVIERWLWEKVAPTYDKMMADPSRLKTIDEVSASLEAHHERYIREKFEISGPSRRRCRRRPEDHLQLHQGRAR
jgi:antitoxin ParD1/3/4